MTETLVRIVAGAAILWAVVTLWVVLRPSRALKQIDALMAITDPLGAHLKDAPKEIHIMWGEMLRHDLGTALKYAEEIDSRFCEDCETWDGCSCVLRRNLSA